ncbi:flagellar hook-associated protein FlgK [Methylobacterium radiodurans]|uniref:Flagellar hook-associated protein 1 n=1 Tax=Methylobacterium radiodurans TaxID=2202828 RepID=A0A2U8VQK7_9HYPH|nr:flagellar hook-associated protein FlgK [Methylobacterium radiodurans]AWN35526.1 flagellar hook-associated protein FlgK [Methylobacterium radiodurans]
MGLDAVNTATAGLRATQASIALVSQNVANAGTAGYVKRSTSPVAQGLNNAGVATGAITRNFDLAALKQLRLETAGSGYTGTKADILGQLEKLYGVPGDATALDGVLNGYTQSLQTLAINPTSAAARSSVVDAAQALATKIGGIAQGVQDLRTGIENTLTGQVQDANALLDSIARLNVQVQTAGDGGTRAALEDQRDQQINKLAGYMDLRVTSERDGSATVMTASGITLVDRGVAAGLSFDGRPTLTANASYDPPETRSVGTLIATLPGGARIALSDEGRLSAGTIAANLELRDTLLPQAQRRLDDLAAGLATATTGRTVAGTVATNPLTNREETTLDLSGMKQPGDRITLQVTGPDGASRNVILVASAFDSKPQAAALSDDATAFVQTVRITPGTPPSLQAIKDALGGLSDAATARGYPAAAVPSLDAAGTAGALTLSGGTGWRVVGGTASVTVPQSISDAQTYPEFALFVDGSAKGLFTDSLDNGAQRTGFAQRLAVNPVVKADTAVLTALGGSATGADATRANFAYGALTQTERTFSSSSGIGGLAAPYSTTLVKFAQDVIAAQGSASAQAQTIDSGQGVALSAAQSRFAEGAAVSIDEEMSNLIALQQAYTANARVLTAARDMLDTLLRM